MTELYPFLHIELSGSGAFNQKTATIVISDNGWPHCFDNLVNHLQPSIFQFEKVKKGVEVCGANCDLA